MLNKIFIILVSFAAIGGYAALTTVSLVSNAVASHADILSAL